jgi:hypothetical protein
VLKGYGATTPSQPGWDMGLAAGGKVKMDIVQDLEKDMWNWRRSKIINVQILNSVAFSDIMRILPSPCTVPIHSYVDAEIPLSAYGDVPASLALESASPILANIMSISEIDDDRGISSGVVLRGDNLMCCLSCESRLCDSM